MEAAAGSQASSHFSLEPITASVLASNETRRRDTLKGLGPCRSGSKELDEYALLGGLERGCVVGVSAQEEDRVGLALGLQVLIRTLCDKKAERALIITPKPAGTILAGLRDGIRAELASRDENEGRSADNPEGDDAQSTRQCLDRVMLSCVFDMDGLWEVLADLDGPGGGEEVASSPPPGAQPPDEGSAEEDKGKREGGGGGSPVLEIEDSEEEDEGFSPVAFTGEQHHNQDQQHQPRQQQHNDKQQGHHHQQPTKQTLPSFILITHFSTLLTSLFTHRAKPAAHSALQLLGSHLRYLSRNLSSNPLIMILNSTASSGTSAANINATTANIGHDSPANFKNNSHSAAQPQKPLDQTLRSIFNPPPLAIPGYHAASAQAPRRNKPSFGLVFSQLLDLHLLCTLIPRSSDDAEIVHGGGGLVVGGEEGGMASHVVPRYVTVVEVLLDEIGLWEGKGGKRRRREQRWAAVDVQNGRIVDAFGDE